MWHVSFRFPQKMSHAHFQNKVPMLSLRDSANREETRCLLKSVYVSAMNVCSFVYLLIKCN